MTMRRSIQEFRRRLGLLFGMNRRNVELVYAHNERRDYPLVDDKIVCKGLLEAAGVPVAPTIATCEGLFAVPSLVHKLRAHESFVLKPASGSGGDGIMVVGKRSAEGWKRASGVLLSEAELRAHLANIVFGAFSNQLEDRALIEERIHQHELFDEFYPRGVSDIRLIVLRGTPVMAMARLPTKHSGGRANLHQGGIGVAIDLETGLTTRAVVHGIALQTHPETGAPLIGRQVPHWDRVVDVGIRAASCVPLGYLGVDLVVDRDRGPVILELNARPGLEIQNVNGLPLGPIVAAVP